MESAQPITDRQQTPTPAQNDVGGNPAEPGGSVVGRLERWARGNPVDAVAAALILVHLAIRGAWISDSWFVEDDFTWIAGSYGQPFSWELLTRDDAGRPLVGCWALSWLITKVAPYEYWPVVVVVLTLLAAAAVLFWRLLRQLFGATAGALIPLTLYLFWAMTTSTTVWWSAGVLRLPAQVAFAGAFLVHLRYLRTRRLRDAVFAAAIVAVGVLFFEKALLIPIVLFWFTVFYAVRGSAVKRVVGTVRTAWRAWVAHAAVALAFIAFYLTHASSPAQEPLTAGRVFELARNVVVTAFATEAWGGPWSWGEDSRAQGAYATPPQVAVWLAAALCLAVVVLSLFAGVRSLGAWTMLAGYLGITVAMLALARLSFGAEIGLADRYLSDVAPVAALAVGLAFLPLRGPGAPPDRVPAAPRSGLLRWLDRAPVAASGLVAAVVAMVAVSSLISAADLNRRWSSVESKPYFAALRADLRAHQGRADMFDATVPDDIVNPLVAPSNRLKVLMRAVPEQPRFPVWTHAFVAPDMLGRLHPGTVNGTPSERGPVPGCGWPLRDGRPAEIALTKSTFAWPWVLKVSYFTNTPTPARITFGGHTEQVELRTGLNDLFVQITGAGDQVRIDGLNPAAQVCVAEIVVGTPAPKVAK